MPGSSSTAYINSSVYKLDSLDRETRQLDSYSTPRHMQSASTGSTGSGTRHTHRLDRHGLDSLSHPRQPLDGASTARQLDSSTARAQPFSHSLSMQHSSRPTMGAIGGPCGGACARAVGLFRWAKVQAPRCLYGRRVWRMLFAFRRGKSLKRTPARRTRYSIMK
jgi:hypothetical protein